MLKRFFVFFVFFVFLFFLLGYAFFPFQNRKHSIILDENSARRKENWLSYFRRVRPGSPNIVLILADDLGKHEISLFGSTNVRTPNLDSIGEQGVIFTDAYCSSPVCSPSRAGLLTGRYPQRFGFETQPMTRYPRNRLELYVYKNFICSEDWIPVSVRSVPRSQDIKKQGVPFSEIMLSEVLHSSGYKTGIMGKWHLGYEPDFQPLSRGFDSEYGFLEAFTLYADETDPDILEYRHDYFANRHIWKQGRTGYCAIRTNGVPVQEKGYLTYRLAEQAAEFIERNKNDPFFLYIPFNAPHTPFQAPKGVAEKYAHVNDPNKQIYYAMIDCLDQAVGTVLKALKEYGLEENTLVIFASDNGSAEYTGAGDNSPLLNGKFTPFEGGVRVPLMVKGPGFKKGRTCNDPVSLLDVFPTVCLSAGIVLPDDLEIDGRAFQDTLMLNDASERDLFWKYGNIRAVRSGKWKMVTDLSSKALVLFELDPAGREIENSAENNPLVVQDLSEKISAWERSHVRPAWPAVMNYRQIVEGQEFLFPL